MNQRLDADDNSTKSEIWNHVIQNQPITCSAQNPERSNRNHGGDEAKEEQRWRERRAKKMEIKKQNEEPKNMSMCPRKTSVSRSLMDTLWAKFKLRKFPTVQDCLSLAFEFSITDKQIRQWFCEKRKKYKKEMSKQKRRRKKKRAVSSKQCTPGMPTPIPERLQNNHKIKASLAYMQSSRVAQAKEQDPISRHTKRKIRKKEETDLKKKTNSEECLPSMSQH